MARTHIFDLLTQAYRLHRESRASGVDYGELVQRKSERSALGRRAFLGAAAAGVLLPTLSGCENDGPISLTGDPRTNVAIVGGGIAGLHCAYRLKQLGLNATIYEAQQRFGGRMWSVHDTIHQGMHIERGGELIDSGHETIHDLVKEFNLQLLDYSQDKAKTKLYGVIGGKVLSDEEILQGFKPIAAKIEESLATLYVPENYVTYSDVNGGEYLDALSIKDWFDQAGIFDSDMRTMIEVCYNIEFGLETDVSSCLNMLVLISTDTTKFDVFGASNGEFHTKTGNGSIPDAVGAQLDPEQILFGNVLVAISELSDGRYTLTFEQDGSTYDVVADYVVLALPFSTLRKVDVRLDLPYAKRAAIDELGYGTNTKLQCGFDSRPWRKAPYDSDGLVYTDLPFQYCFETSRLQDPKSDRGILTDYTGGLAGLRVGSSTKEARRDEFLDQLEPVFAGVKAASNGKVERMFWADFPWTRGSYSSYLVGQYSKFATVEPEPFKNVFFCGEHTSFDYQGYMEGGARSGARAALEVAEALGLSASAESALIAAPENHPSAQIRILRRALLEKRHGRTRRALKPLVSGRRALVR